MNKKTIRHYKALLVEAETLERYLKKLEKQADSVPIVKDKVQKSQKDFPYILTHEVVEAPVPVKYSSIQRNIIKTRKLIEKNLLESVQTALKIEQWIDTFQDPRTRAVLRDVIINNREQVDVAIEHDLTEGRISQIITGAINEGC